MKTSLLFSVFFKVVTTPSAIGTQYVCEPRWFTPTWYVKRCLRGLMAAPQVRNMRVWGPDGEGVDL